MHTTNLNPHIHMDKLTVKVKSVTIIFMLHSWCCSKLASLHYLRLAYTYITLLKRSAAYHHKRAKHEGRTWPSPDCGNAYVHKDTLKCHRYSKHPAIEDFRGDSIQSDAKKLKQDQQTAGSSSSISLSDTGSDDSILLEDMELGTEHATIVDVFKLPFLA